MANMKLFSLAILIFVSRNQEVNAQFGPAATADSEKLFNEIKQISANFTSTTQQLREEMTKAINAIENYLDSQVFIPKNGKTMDALRLAREGVFGKVNQTESGAPLTLDDQPPQSCESLPNLIAATGQLLKNITEASSHWSSQKDVLTTNLLGASAYAASFKFLMSSASKKKAEEFVNLLQSYINSFTANLKKFEEMKNAVRRNLGLQNVLQGRWCDSTPIPEEVIQATDLQLLTRANPKEFQTLDFDNMSSVLASNFDASKPTRILIHGFLSDPSTFSEIKDNYLKLFDVNIILVNWKDIARNINYLYSASQIRHVGAVVAKLLDNMIQNQILENLNNVYCIGHSLGAHTCGFVGKQLTQGILNTIGGLDPAGVAFDKNNVAERLDSSDANYVYIIHSDANFYGINAAIGHADWFPNGGKGMPGCEAKLNVCDHGFSKELFKESLNSTMLWGRKCADFAEMEADKCVGEGFSLGGDPSNPSVRGIFRFKTNSKSPYGRGIY